MCVAAVSAASVSFAWFQEPGDKINEEIVDGQIALRGYFFSGNGSEEHPYEIVSPNHLYNLSRLQNLGVFPTTAHFRIGHDFDPDDEITDYQCLDAEGNRADERDMGPFLEDNPTLTFRPVGSESTPFRGIFKGNGIPVKNLIISGYPEDIGVFGYVSYDGYVEGLVCSDLEIRSLGYTKYATQPDIYELYSTNIDDIFDEAAHYLASQTSLSFYEKDGSSYVERPLKAVNGLGGTELTEIDADVVQVSVGSDADDEKQNDRFIPKIGYFLPTFPSINDDPFTYSWISSSSLIRETDALNVDLDGDGKNDKVIAFDLNLLHYAGDGEGQFNNTEANMEVSARLSLTASVTIDGVVYSRVIQSYGLEFYSNNHVCGDGHLSANIYCNYTIPKDPNHPDTNYHHGNNIGFLVGHLDGTLDNSYVYNGKFVFNEDDSCHPIITETTLGLVGEVGTNVINALDPDYNSTVQGEIGIMNFTRIYEGIRHNFVGGETVYSGTESGSKFVAYDGKDKAGNDIINTGPTGLFSLYEPYLRHTDSGHYITPVDGDVSNSTWGTTTVPNSVPAKFNTVDFLFNNLIEDEYDGEGNITADRGLGVFKIATPRNTSADGKAYGLVWNYSWGDCRIYSGTPRNKVYFSTAEYDHTYDGYNPSWGISSDQVDPLRAATLPAYSDVFTFNYPFSRDYNYVFELDLSQNSESSKFNYMYNTDSPFLTNYLSSVLRDKNGEVITHGNYRFGFMFRSSENAVLNSLSSYMELDKPGKTVNYGGGIYYPSNSIIFKIENEKGANVSVVGNEKNISIYKFRTDASANPVELYTMYSENIYDEQKDPRYLDSHRYFTYDYRPAANGATSNVCVPYSENNMGDKDKALFGHIFHLPKSEDGYMYAIGRAQGGFTSSDGKAKLYYLAVQGQTAGTIDTNKIADVGNHLDNVDFLTSEPAKSDYASLVGYTPKRAFINFSANFNTIDGELDIKSKTVATENYLLFEYDNDPQFITAMTAYDFKNVHGFYVNSESMKRNSAAEPIV